MARILLIDDDVDLVASNKAVLEAGGHEVTAAYTAADGWAAIERCPPDGVVLDVMMEAFDAGFRLAHRIAARYPRLPIVMLTGVDDHLDAQTLDAQDRDGGWMPVHRFMQKPVGPAVLLHEVDVVLEEAAGARPHAP